ncbi:CDP-diacylglycerol--glycerol-3-phosphate 3-phosphatidyltransferase [Candidatus Saganbacteria bacterium]|nr:CDP-diacylglycerol--glycerol-3-phosphate 3-phosphatidyltransferase [Candidatus Saganbacteria bacterium]
MSLPNLITLGRILALPLFLALLYFAPPVWAAGCFLVLALSDAADGILARYLGEVTDLGKILDPLADKVIVVSALIALIDLRNVPALPVIIIVARDLLVSAGRTSGAGIWGKIKTVFQIVAVLMLILNWPYAILVLWFAVFLSLISGVDYFVGSTGS